MKGIFFLLLTLPILTLAQIPEPKPNTYVNDFTGLLSADEIKVLNDTLYSIEKRTSVQVAIVLINKLPDNMEIEEYSLQVGRKWHVGNAKNGLTYVAAIGQRKQRLEVARELEGDIPDITALEITDRVKPYFREKDYFTGLLTLLAGIQERINPVEQLKLDEAEKEKKGSTGGFPAIPVVLGFGVWLAALAAFMKHKLGKKKIEIYKEPEHYADSVISQRSFVPPYPSGRYKNHSNPIKQSDDYIPPVYTPPSNDTPSTPYEPPATDYGNWGKDNSTPSDSGLSGGGATDNW